MNIYISNLGFDLQNDDLKSLFSPFGEVSSSKVITDHDSGKSRGFGFVEMPDSEAAMAAVSNLNGKVMNGKALAVNEARPKDSSPRRNNFR